MNPFYSVPINIELLVGVLLLIIGTLYGYWSYILKTKRENPSISYRVNRVHDILLPVGICIAGIIMIWNSFE